MISLIVACSQNRTIGYQGKLPWYIKEDLQFFKKKTIGKPIIMGRITFESLPNILPNRQSFVVTRQKNYSHPNIKKIKIIHTLTDALQATQNYPETMIIGGEQIFKEALPYADFIYMTLIHRIVKGDALFPSLGKEWKEVYRKKGELFDFIQFKKNT